MDGHALLVSKVGMGRLLIWYGIVRYLNVSILETAETFSVILMLQ